MLFDLLVFSLGRRQWAIVFNIRTPSPLHS